MEEPIDDIAAEIDAVDLERSGSLGSLATERAAERILEEIERPSSALPERRRSLSALDPPPSFRSESYTIRDSPRTTSALDLPSSKRSLPITNGVSLDPPMSFRNDTTLINFPPVAFEPTVGERIGREEDVIKISDTTFAGRRRALNRLLNSVRSLGAELDVDIPGIVVVGNQSAGKSSLVEAISGVHVPRDAGSTTNAPFEVRCVWSESPWTCRVKLRIMYDHLGRVVQPVREIVFGPPLHDPRHVEDRLRRAQHALLADWDDPLRLLRVAQHEFPPLTRRVSRNIVCVEVSGPDVTDLSFIDLPGLVSNADLRTVETIEALVRHYIRRHNIILLTLPMTEDRETQKAALLAREVDPRGERTIGVLTKPDMREHGADTRLLAAFRGERDRLAGGYFITRQPDTAARRMRIGIAEARRQEAEFFNRPEWRNMSPALRHRLGTRALIEALSRLLCVHIERVRAPLEETITIKHREVLRRLENLPTVSIEVSTTNPSVQLVQLCNALHNELEAQVRGLDNHRRLWHRAKDIYTLLARRIDAARPIFHPWPKSHPLAETFRTITISTRSEQVVALHSSVGTVTLHLDDVRRHIENATTRELPFSVPYAAKESLNRIPLPKWRELVHEALEASKMLFVGLVRDEVDRIFGPHPVLKSEVRAIANDEIERTFRRCHDFVDRTLRLEQTPLTLHAHDVGKLRRASLDELRLMRRSHGEARVDVVTWDRIDEMWEQELFACADSMAYHNIASKRIADAACMAIHSELFEPLPKKILDGLLHRLKIHDHAHAVRLLGVVEHRRGGDPAVERLRVELREQSDRLVRVKEEFQRFSADIRVD